MSLIQLPLKWYLWPLFEVLCVAAFSQLCDHNSGALQEFAFMMTAVSYSHVITICYLCFPQAKSIGKVVGKIASYSHKLLLPLFLLRRPMCAHNTPPPACGPTSPPTLHNAHLHPPLTCQWPLPTHQKLWWHTTTLLQPFCSLPRTLTCTHLTDLGLRWWPGWSGLLLLSNAVMWHHAMQPYKLAT